jgi:hypothetical protein
MYFLFVLAISNVTTWQAALNTERAEAVIPSDVALKHVERGELEWFVRANQSLNFDETVQVALRDDDRSAVLLACHVKNWNLDSDIWAAHEKVAAALDCDGARECSMLAVDVRDFREACLDLAVERWRKADPAGLTASR